jgi:hypothetical protein
MQKFTALLILTVFIMGIGMVFAQDATSTPNPEATEEVTIIEVPDVLVICPGENVLPTVRDAAELVIDFTDTDGVITIPSGNVLEAENGYIVEVTEIEINCDTPEAEVAAELDRTEGTGVNETVPQPENAPGVASTQPGYLIVNSTNVNLRSCDNPNCSRVGIVHGGDELIVLGRNEDTTWWYVQAGEVRGWIFAELVLIRGDLSGTAVVETEGEPTPPSVYIGFTGNLIYDVLSENGQAICAVQGGREYPLIARNADDTWLWIEAECTDGRIVQGWISADVVAIRNTGNVFVPIVGINGPEDSE